MKGFGGTVVPFNVSQQIEANDLRQFLGKLRIVAEFEALHPIIARRNERSRKAGGRSEDTADALAVPVFLTEVQKSQLLAYSWGRKTPARLMTRSRIVLLSRRRRAGHSSGKAHRRILCNSPCE